MAEPEVWFRIVHVSMAGHHGATAAAYREQMVEITLVPKGRSSPGTSAP